MKEPETAGQAVSEDSPEARRRAYERPQIVWREPYEPVSFGVSCAQQPGNPPCVGFFSG